MRFEPRPISRRITIPPVIDRIEVAAAFESGLAEVDQRWPEAPVDAAAFASHVRAHVGAQPNLSAMLPRFHVADLFLAWWAMTSWDGIIAFERELGDDLVHMMRRFACDPCVLMQTLRTELFLADDPRIAEFSGFGSLRSWVEVVATRIFIDASRPGERPARAQARGTNGLPGVLGNAGSGSSGRGG